MFISAYGYICIECMDQITCVLVEKSIAEHRKKTIILMVAPSFKSVLWQFGRNLWPKGTVICTIVDTAGMAGITGDGVIRPAGDVQMLIGNGRLAGVEASRA
jgi:hypothetical protein